MPAQYLDQFYAIDPYAPPSAGTTLEVQKYDLVDADDDGDIGRSGGDTVNGLDVTSTYQSDSVTVRLSDGSTTTISGTTFYLSDGSAVFTPNDGSVLEDSTLISTTYSTGQKDMAVSDLGPPCFTAGTFILTPEGQLPVEELKPGMSVCGQAGNTLTIRSVLSAAFTKRELGAKPNLFPVRIVAGALGNGIPVRDLVVSRQHRVLVNTPIVERMFSQKNVLIPAVKLSELPGIYVDSTVDFVIYYHLVFDNHEIVYSEGAATESLFTGPEALRSISDEARNELFSIFPDLKVDDNKMEPCYLIPEGKKQKALVKKIGSKAANQIVLQNRP